MRKPSLRNRATPHAVQTWSVGPAPSVAGSSLAQVVNGRLQFREARDSRPE